MKKSFKTFAKIPFAPIVALLFGVAITILILATPQWLFEQAINASGLPTLISAAKPPLGDIARILVAVFGGLSVFALLWLGLGLISRALKKQRPSVIKAKGSRIDHEDVTIQRKPIFAQSDLGAPFMSDEAIEGPLDELVLDMPMVETVEDIQISAIVAPSEPDLITEVQPEPRLPVDHSSVAALMARLESALDRRAGQGGNIKQTPDMDALRDALDTGFLKFAAGR